MPRGDAQAPRQPGLGLDRITDGDEGEPGTVGFAVLRNTGGAGGSVTAAQHVGAHHKVLIGVNNGAGANEAFPPTIFLGLAPADVRASGQGMLDQHGIVTGGVQCPPAFKSHGHRGQHAPGL